MSSTSNASTTAWLQLKRLLVLLLCASFATPAAAWKPKTHIYLAELARQDAVNDGKVTIYETNYETGRIVGPLGNFEVNPAVLAALRQKPEQFRAGVVGPDAYPDLLTGQQLIHPGTNKSLLGDPTRGDLPSAAGADAWLTHLWRKAYGPRTEVEERLSQGPGANLLGFPRNDTPEIRAFVAGYVTHAAGDMFMHTFVNHYAGGDFSITPDPKNAVKHIIVEGYVGLRAPEMAVNGSIAGVDGFIYREMVQAAPGSVLQDRLLQGDGEKSSLPAIFSRLRNSLQRDVDTYDRERMSRSGPSRLAYAAANGPEAEYKRAWVKDIDNGLRAWPQVSHDIAVAMIYDHADTDRAKAVISKYLQDHLISMAGVPDFAIATVAFIRKVTSAALPAMLAEALAFITVKPLDWMIEGATGKTLSEWSDYVSKPDTNFDPVMNAPGGGYGGQKEILTSLARFNKDVLKIDDPGVQFMDRRFKVDDFPPAFNTVQMTKLTFLSEKGMTDLLAALKAKGVATPALPGKVGKYENPMLGFLTSLDGGNRWQGDGKGHAFFLATGEAGGWRKLFLKQIGEREGWTRNTTPEQRPPADLDDTGFQTNDGWAVRLDDVTYNAATGAGRNVLVTATFRNDASQPMPFTARTARTMLDRSSGAQVASLRASFLHQTETDLPAWHYLPDTPIPPKGRITVRYVFDVGDKAAQQQLKAWTVIEQKPSFGGAGLSIFKYVDGKTIKIPLPPFGDTGTATDGGSGGGGPTAKPLPGVDRGPGGYAASSFSTAGVVSYRLDAAGRRGGPEAPMEVALTGRGESPKRVSLQTAYNTFVLIGSDGVEYRTDGNTYMLTGAEPMKRGRPLQKGEQAMFTLVFPKVPLGVKAQRLLVKGDNTVKVEFYLDGAPLNRPTYAPAAAEAGGTMAGQKVALNGVEARLISLNRGDDRDWEAVIGFRTPGSYPKRVTASDVALSVSDASGETRHMLGNCYEADNPGRKLRAEALMLPPGFEVRVRVWFPESRALAPARYKFHENYGVSKGGQIPASMTAGNDR